LNKENISSGNLLVSVVDANEYNEDKIDAEDVVFLICSTYSDGTPPKSAARMMEWFQDMINDFRVNRNHLEKLKFSIFGLGGAIYNENYGKAVIISFFCLDESFYVILIYH
jgi:sulfite reductase alpha subunit-like flavoprotein